MRYRLSMCVLIGLSALCWTSCASSRKASEVSSSKIQVSSVERVEDGRDSLLLTSYGLRDSVKEVTTITIQLNDRGDTVNRSTVTERTIVRDRTRDSQLRVKSEKSRVDTVSVVQKDSLNRSVNTVAVAAGGGIEIDKDGNLTKRDTPLRSTLKWIFAILCVVTILVIIIKISLRKL